MDTPTPMREIVTNAIIEATREISLAFLNMDIQAGPAIFNVEGKDYKAAQAETTAIVGLQGDFSGGVHLAAPKYVALNLSSALAGDRFTTFTDKEARDAFMEISNMIAGGVQGQLIEEERVLKLVPPIMIFGKSCGMYYQDDLDSVRQYFKTPEGPFFIECFFN